MSYLHLTAQRGYGGYSVMRGLMLKYGLHMTPEDFIQRIETVQGDERRFDERVVAFVLDDGLEVRDVRKDLRTPSSGIRRDRRIIQFVVKSRAFKTRLQAVDPAACAELLAYEDN